MLTITSVNYNIFFYIRDLKDSGIYKLKLDQIVTRKLKVRLVKNF